MKYGLKVKNQKKSRHGKLPRSILKREIPCAERLRVSKKNRPRKTSRKKPLKICDMIFYVCGLHFVQKFKMIAKNENKLKAFQIIKIQFQALLVKETKWRGQFFSYIKLEFEIVMICR